MTIRYGNDEPPTAAAMRRLWLSAWRAPGPDDWSRVLGRSLAFVTAHAGDELVGFANVAWDGGTHASLFDVTVHAAWQRRGIGSELVRRATVLAQRRGAGWLHVDYEPHLAPFYEACGFGHTEAGLRRLGASGT